MRCCCRSNSADQTIAIGKQIGACLTRGDVVALQGTLGAGKTTITKGIAAALGVTDTVTSPTFCLISEYDGAMPLYHMDVYRLDGAEDFQNIGASDLIYGDGVSVIEWSEKIMDELPERTIVISITPDIADGRTIVIDNWPYGAIA